MIVNGKNIYSELNKNNNTINLGIQLLRMILCFWVIVYHFSRSKKKIVQTFYHVPTFMFISFYLSYKIFFTQNLIKIKNRLQRLAIPFIILPLIDIIIRIFISFSKLIKNIKIIIFNLLLQYITGYKTYVILWFVHNMLILTIFFIILFYFFKEKTSFVIIILIIISYWVQYSDLNFKLFRKCNYYLVSASRLAEMLPIALTGLILGSIKLLKTLEKNKNYSFFFSFIILYFTYNYNLFTEFRGFKYNGIKQNIASICLFVLFSLL